MDEALTALLEATSRFEYLIAKKEYKKLVNLMTLNIEEGDIFRRCQLKPHEKLIKNMLHKCDEIDLAVEGDHPISFRNINLMSILFLTLIISFVFQMFHTLAMYSLCTRA